MSISDNTLSVVPLGGLGEIGLNMTCIEYGDDIIVVDAGVMFPEEEMLGIDLIIPDYAYLRENHEKIRAFIITHGHEDHTGALPYILREINVPVYGTRLTLGLISGKLKEHRLLDTTELVTVKPRETVEIGCFRVEFIRVTHSIVDAVALAITTPVGVVIHSGDFKLDQTPIDGEVLDMARFAEYGDRGVLCLLSDSTNSEKEGYTLSEREVGRAIDEIFSQSEKRVIVATFASNIHRIQQIADAAVKYGRKIALSGRSMVANVQIARDLGYLRIPLDALIKIDDIRKFHDCEVAIITTGSQGEPMSALSRMAMNDHKQVQINEGDTVVISAKVIPGNEKSISRIINHFFRRGAKVFYERVSEIHVSGHAAQEEQKVMLHLVRPRYFIPVHGEYRHLVHHARLAQLVGIPRERIFVIEDGEVVEFEHDGGEVVGARAGIVTAGRIFVDGKGVGDVGEVVLRDRMRLAHDGVVIVIIGIEQHTGKVVSGPDIISRGFVFEDASQDLLSEVKEAVNGVLSGMGQEIKSEWSVVQADVRSALKKFIFKRMERKPMILPIIMEV